MLAVLWEASPASGSDINLSTGNQQGWYIATCNPSEGKLFSHLSSGMWARIGDVVGQDKAYTIGVLLCLVSFYEVEWSNLGLGMLMESLCSCVFLLLTCLGGMRVYKAIWTDLAALQHNMQYCESMDDYSTVSWPVVGWFKAHGGVAGCYMIPIVGTTASGILFFTWTQRFLYRLLVSRISNRWAFWQPGGSHADASD